MTLINPLIFFDKFNSFLDLHRPNKELDQLGNLDLQANHVVPPQYSVLKTQYLLKTSTSQNSLYRKICTYDPKSEINTYISRISYQKLLKQSYFINIFSIFHGIY